MAVHGSSRLQGMALTGWRLLVVLLLAIVPVGFGLAHSGSAHHSKEHKKQKALREDDADGQPNGHLVSLRENSCRDFIAKWAAAGVVDLALVCREAYTDVACTAAEASFGGDWPEFGLYPPGEVASRGCAVLEDRLRHAQSLVFTQLSAQTERLYEQDAATKEVSTKDAEHPPWVRNAFVLNEDDLWSDIPFPHSVGASTHDGPRLYPSSREKQIKQEQDDFNFRYFGIWPHGAENSNDTATMG
mmetsp:Transcript_73541/g.137424  ORF Transcript_73541/g.137424 Transcript_73541/m.137424 type:complete len:244 (+) Transcript_73541:66-797(+)